MTKYTPGRWGRMFCKNSKWSLTLGGKQSTLNAPNGRRLSLATAIFAEAQLSPGLIWSNISFVIEERHLSLTGLTNGHARQLIQEATRLVDGELKREFKAMQPHLDVLHASVQALLQRDRYIRNFDVQHFLDAEEERRIHLPRIGILLKLPLFSGSTYHQVRTQFALIQDVLTPPYIGITRRNEKFVFDEKKNAAWQTFFAEVEKTPLTPEQQEAVVIHEDRNRLIAAAGSGKSSTLVAKVGYAIKKGYVTPDQVLALAFNTKAADEIAERLKSRLGIAIKAKTFHSAGKEMVETVSGKKQPAKNISQRLQNIVTDLCQSDAAFHTLWLFFKAVHWEAEPEKEFSSVDSYEKHIRSACVKKKDRDTWGIPSLRGDAVRSYEELAIANWLYVHGIAYHYEPLYEHDVTEHGWTKYEPDFVYETAGGQRIYHEHFALRADGTSPFGESYEQSVKDKRALHAKFGTILIETSSGDFQDGSIFASLEQALQLHGIALNQKSPEELKEILKERNDRDLVKLMQTLIAHAKESGYDESHFVTRAKGQRDGARTALFLKLLFPVWRKYTEWLEATNHIDFADMIGLAANLAASGDYVSTAKLILVDEFQDISPGRARLVKALLGQHPDSVLFGVGDDWQAINRFAGSDLSIMRDFETNFGKTETRYLSKTFRSNQGISNVSARFVMKNDAQLEKQVEAVTPETDGVVRIVEYDDDEALKACIGAKLAELAQLSVSRGNIITVLIIGRYQYETTKVITDADIDGWNALHKGHVEIKKNAKKKDTSSPLDTVHKSKGLEADFVFIHSMQAKRYAFPCEMEDDPLLALSYADQERFPFAEERRLFYVALTRAREQVTLFSSSKEPSRFVLELLQPEYGDAVVFEGKEEKPVICSACNQGYMQLIPGKFSDFYGCTRYRSLDCTNKLKKRVQMRKAA